MSIASKPRYSDYLSQVDDTIFDQVWSPKLAVLSADLSWIDEMEAQNNETYSRDFEHDDFPTYYNWPKSWREAFEAAKREWHLLKKAHLERAEVHRVDGDVVYILGDEVWFSTNYYANGDIYKMAVSDRDKEHEFDSVVSAAYALINDFKEWEQTHGKAYEMANILSKIERPFADLISVVGTTQECDLCGGYALIAKEEDGNAICCHCASTNS